MCCDKMISVFDGRDYVIFFYPGDIDILNRLYDAVGGNGAEFRRLLSAIPEFVEMWRPRRGDWFWAASFYLNGKTISIYFPWCQKPYTAMSRLDKSIVLSGINVQEKLFLAIFQKVVDVFWNKYFSFCCHDPQRKLPKDIFSRTLNNGRKAVPAWYVNVRAYLNPVSGGDVLLSHLAAKKWFEDQGYIVV